MEIAKAKVANALTSAASDHVIAVTADIYDENQNKYQSVINAQVIQDIEDLKENGGGGGSLDVDLSDYYTKTETDNMLDEKLNNSDIAEWAKLNNKPTYEIDEITGLEDALLEKVNNNNLSTILLNELKNYTSTEDLNSLLSNKLDIIKVSYINIIKEGYTLSDNNTRYLIINSSNSNYLLAISGNLSNSLFYIELVITLGSTLPEITLPQIKWVKPIEFVENATYYIAIEKIGDDIIGMWAAVSNN